MCGIGGFTDISFLKNREEIAQKLLESLSHRGPDGSGLYQSEKVVLVHTRLSIIDLSANGNQPLYSEDRQIVLICNGEIYNYLSIRKELIEKGHQFSSTSDSEVIIHLYEEYKGDIKRVLNDLIGMFAFAIWDTKTEKLVIARDRLGIKPLYFSIHDNSLAFSSEVKPLIASGLATHRLDETSLFEYFLTGSIPEPNTWSKDIKALSPGHILVWESGKTSISKYWSLSCNINSSYKNINEVVEQTDYLLRKVIKDHLVADVNLGCFLSAGIDSSVISYYASRENRGVHTFTASFPGEPEDESLIANQTAKKLGATPHNFNIETDFFENYGDFFHHIDQPFGISSALSLSRISEMAGREVKVVLSGDGADELFAGYSRHQPFFNPPYFKCLPNSVRQNLFLALGRLFGKNSLIEAADYFNKSPSSKYLERVNILDKEQSMRLIDINLRPQVDEERYLNRIESIWNNFEGNDPINQMLYVDIQTSLVDEMLVKADRMTMHQGIEGRVPFMDHRLVEFAMSVPSHLKIQGGFGKLPLRQIVKKHIGQELAFREKTGFNSPLKRMLMEDGSTMGDFSTKTAKLKKSSFINPAEIDIFLQSVKSGTFNSSTAFGLYALADFQERL